MREHWVDPSQVHVVEHYTTTVQEAANRRGIKPCDICHGIGTVVMVHPVTKDPFNVACSSCGL